MQGGVITSSATTLTRDTPSEDVLCQSIAYILPGCFLAMRNNEEHKKEFVFFYNRSRNFRERERLTNFLHGTNLIYLKSDHRQMKSDRFHRSF